MVIARYKNHDLAFIFFVKIIARVVALLLVAQVAACQAKAATPLLTHPQPVATQITQYQLNSTILGHQRPIYLALPPNYDLSTRKYPVIFVLDAEFLFDITRSIVEIRAARNYMPESIIVGIPSLGERRYDMSLTLFKDNGKAYFPGANGNPDQYLDFLQQEVIQALESQFRVNHHRTIIGMSPSFGPVLTAFWSRPELFSGYIVLAAELNMKLASGLSVADKVYQALTDREHPPAAIYMAKGGRDLRKRGAGEVAAFARLSNVRADKVNPKINYGFEIIADEDHYGVAIPGIQRGLSVLYPRELWDLDYRQVWRSEEPAKALGAMYERLSTHHGFEVAPILDSYYFGQTLLGGARRLESQGRYKELVQWLKMASRFYPGSAAVATRLARTSQAAEQRRLSKLDK